MAVYKLSGKANADVDAIYEYTIVNFGIEQARAYLLGLGDCFKALAENPLRGRATDPSTPHAGVTKTNFHASQASRS